MKRQEERKRKLAEVGIKYDFDAVAYVSAFLLVLPPATADRRAPEKETKVFVGINTNVLTSLNILFDFRCSNAEESLSLLSDPDISAKWFHHFVRCDSAFGQTTSYRYK
jgi:hypothetical protein